MTKTKKRHKTIIVLAGTFFMIVGTYNAIVINYSSSVTSSDIKFVKRLDEMDGVIKPGRRMAAVKTWKKLNHHENLKSVEVQQQEAQVLIQAPPSVREDMSLNLVEVINPNKYQSGLALTQFSGSMTTINGTIESLTASLPNDETVSISFAEMSGNVFKYDMNNEIYSGMMFQVDQTSYMVTFTNGPLEGTRLKFLNSAKVEEEVQAFSDETGIETGSFSTEKQSPESMVDTSLEQAPQMQAQVFNFDNQSL